MNERIIPTITSSTLLQHEQNDKNKQVILEKINIFSISFELKIHRNHMICLIIEKEYLRKINETYHATRWPSSYIHLQTRRLAN